MANDDEAIVGRTLAQFMNASTDPFERRMVAAYIEGGTDGLIQTAHPHGVPVDGRDLSAYPELGYSSL